MKSYNIYLSGVGGQGIGLLSEMLLRSADHAGLTVKGVDTHGLAQRGGVVVSRIRIGNEAHSPLIGRNDADIVVSLEVHEAFRAMNFYLRDNGILVYYDTIWQPLQVRTGEAAEIHAGLIQEEAEKRSIRVIRAFQEGLKDPRMQNMVLLSAIKRHALIQEITETHYLNAMEDLLQGKTLENNRKLFLQLI